VLRPARSRSASNLPLSSVLASDNHLVRLAAVKQGIAGQIELGRQTIVCWTALMSHVVMPEARVHASDLFISNDMGGSEVSSLR
jgi:hypothetical protein